jgi:hypothetical protein
MIGVAFSADTADPDGNEFCVLRAFTAGELAAP